MMTFTKSLWVWVRVSVAPLTNRGAGRFFPTQNNTNKNINDDNNNNNNNDNTNIRGSIPTRVLGEIVLRTVFGGWTMGIPNMVDVLG